MNCYFNVLLPVCFTFITTLVQKMTTSTWEPRITSKFWTLPVMSNPFALKLDHSLQEVYS